MMKRVVLGEISVMSLSACHDLFSQDITASMKIVDRLEAEASGVLDGLR